MSDQKIELTQAELDAKIEDAKKGVIGELTSVREENRGMKSRLEQIQKDFDAMKAQADKAAQEAEKTKLEGQGKYEEALAHAKAGYDAELKKHTDKITELTSRLETVSIDNAIMGVCGDAINPKQVVTLLKSEYSVKLKDDGTVEIATSDGKPVFGADSKPVTDLAGLTSKYLSDNQHLVKASGTAGAGTHSTTTPTGEKTIDQQIKDAQERGDRSTVTKLKMQLQRQYQNTVPGAPPKKE